MLFRTCRPCIYGRNTPILSVINHAHSINDFTVVTGDDMLARRTLSRVMRLMLETISRHVRRKKRSTAAVLAAVSMALANPALPSLARNRIKTVPVQSHSIAFASDVVAVTVHLTSSADDLVTLVIDGPREIPVEAMALTGPDRLVIDMPKVAFLPAALSIPEKGPIADFRYGLFIADRSRVVLDLRAPAIVDRIDTLPTDAGVRTVVTIRPTSADSFVLAAHDSAALRYTGGVRNKAVAQNGEVTAQRAGDYRAALGPSTPSPDPVTPDATAKVQLPLIMLDPGHGGIDVGAAGANGELEKALVLKVAGLIREKLQSGGRVRVEMTRDSDVFVPLPERVRLARAKSAALFISIHADILSGEPNVRGATVYTLSDKASDLSAARLAEKENRSDQIAGIDVGDDSEDVSDILFDLARRETRQFSLSFAKNLIGKLQGPTQINKNPHRFAGFRVLKAPDVPSVLLELGYLSSADDAKQLSSPEWQEKVAGAAADAIEKYVMAHSSGAAALDQ